MWMLERDEFDRDILEAKREVKRLERLKADFAKHIPNNCAWCLSGGSVSVHFDAEIRDSRMFRVECEECRIVGPQYRIRDVAIGAWDDIQNRIAKGDSGVLSAPRRAAMIAQAKR